MRHPSKKLYVITGVLYFPIGSILAWNAYNTAVAFAHKCQYDKAEKKVKRDGLLMMGLIAVWLVLIVMIIPEHF